MSELCWHWYGARSKSEPVGKRLPTKDFREHRGPRPAWDSPTVSDGPSDGPISRSSATSTFESRRVERSKTSLSRLGGLWKARSIFCERLLLTRTTCWRIARNACAVHSEGVGGGTRRARQLLLTHSSQTRRLARTAAGRQKIVARRRAAPSAPRNVLPMSTAQNGRSASRARHHRQVLRRSGREALPRNQGSPQRTDQKNDRSRQKRSAVELRASERVFQAHGALRWGPKSRPEAGERPRGPSRTAIPQLLRQLQRHGAHRRVHSLNGHLRARSSTRAQEKGSGSYSYVTVFCCVHARLEISLSAINLREARKSPQAMSPHESWPSSPLASEK